MTFGYFRLTDREKCCCLLWWSLHWSCTSDLPCFDGWGERHPLWLVSSNALQCPMSLGYLHSSWCHRALLPDPSIGCVALNVDPFLQDVGEFDASLYRSYESSTDKRLLSFVGESGGKSTWCYWLSSSGATAADLSVDLQIFKTLLIQWQGVWIHWFFVCSLETEAKAATFPVPSLF